MTQASRTKLVVGIDAALVHTAVATIEDGRAGWKGTITVEGDTEDTGPRYAVLRKALEELLTKKLQGKRPLVVAIEQPEHSLRKRKLKGRNVRVQADPGNIMKLYGGFAVVYAEVCRLYPKATVVGVLPERWKGRMDKRLSASVFGAKYGIRHFANWDEADALGIADYAWDFLMAQERKRLKGLE